MKPFVLGEEEAELLGNLMAAGMSGQEAMKIVTVANRVAHEIADLITNGMDAHVGVKLAMGLAELDEPETTQPGYKPVGEN